MSFFYKSISKCSTHFGRSFILPYRGIHVTQAQQLYAISALGIDGYLQSRKRIREQFSNFSDKFRTKMTEFVSDSKNMIFTEDLKNMIHIAEPNDLDLVINMIKKFNTQKTEFRFSSFVFGPIVMRMFHFLDAPNEAIKVRVDYNIYGLVEHTLPGECDLQSIATPRVEEWTKSLLLRPIVCFEDPVNEDFFAQLVSYQILLDLLYNHEMYDEMYRIFEKIQHKQLNMTKFPKYTVVLILAACYKQNTPKSFEYATKLWSEMVEVGTVPLRRSATFMAALALNQGSPHLALEAVALQKLHYITIRNIRAVALAQLGRLDDSLAVLRGVLEIDQPEQKDKHTFFEETMTKVKQIMEKSDDKDTLKGYENIEKALRDRGLIDKQTLDQLITSDIVIRSEKKYPSSGMPRMQYGNRQKNRNL